MDPKYPRKVSKPTCLSLFKEQYETCAWPKSILFPLTLSHRLDLSCNFLMSGCVSIKTSVSTILISMGACTLAKQMSAPSAFRQCSIWRSPRAKRQWSVATRQAEQIAKLIIITGNAPQIRGRRHQKWQPGRDIASASARAGLLRLRLWREYGKSIRAANLKLASHFAECENIFDRVHTYVCMSVCSPTGTWGSATVWVEPQSECSRVLLAQIESIVCANNKLVCPEAN